MSRASSWAVVGIRVVGWCGKLAFIRTLGCHVAGGCTVLREFFFSDPAEDPATLVELPHSFAN